MKIVVLKITWRQQLKMRKIEIYGKISAKVIKPYHNELRNASYGDSCFDKDPYSNDEKVNMHVIVYVKIPIFFSKEKSLNAIMGLISPKNDINNDVFRNNILAMLNGIAYYDSKVIKDMTVEKRYSLKQHTQIWMQSQTEMEDAKFDMIKLFKENIEEREKFKKQGRGWIYSPK